MKFCACLLNCVTEFREMTSLKSNPAFFTLTDFSVEQKNSSMYLLYSKGKGPPQQAEVAQGVPGSLRPRIFLTFDTTRVVDRQPYAPAAFTPGEIPGTHF